LRSIVIASWDRGGALDMLQMIDSTLVGALRCAPGEQTEERNQAPGSLCLSACGCLSSGKQQYLVSKPLHALRSRIECIIGHLKEQRRIATRCGKLAGSSIGFALLGCLRIWARFVHRASVLVFYRSQMLHVINRVQRAVIQSLLRSLRM
jgi:hypothetical protein